MSFDSSFRLRTITSFTLISIAAALLLTARATANHAADIVYKQTISPILVTSDIMGWPPGFLLLVEPLL